MSIKKLYNKWLFKKYGFNRGTLFEKVIPKHKNSILFRLLFSPSLFSYYEGEEIAKEFKEGLNKEVIIDNKIIDYLKSKGDE